MRFKEIKETFLDYPDNESWAIIVFFTGCAWKCKNCQNKELQDINSGEDINVEVLSDQIKQFAKRSGTNKVVLSGGDPFYQHEELAELLNHLNNLDICIYTGYSIEEAFNLLISFNCHNMPLYIKCGIYDENERDSDMGKSEKKFVLASKNQAFYKWNGAGYCKISDNNILRFENG